MNPCSYQQFSFNSQILQDNLSIEIALPDGYDASADREYPSIYLLDANYFFDDGPGTLDEYLERGVGMTHIVRSLAGEGRIPPSLLIGIGYSEEQRIKFTVHEAESFYEFFVAELIPEVETNFRASKLAQDRLLFGYSASAHFSTYALMQDVHRGVETFNKFISISGVYDRSLAANKLEGKIYRELGKGAMAGRQLYMAIGADDPKVELLAAHRRFVRTLVGRGYSGFKLMHTEYPGKGHYDIPESGFSEGLMRLFSG